MNNRIQFIRQKKKQPHSKNITIIINYLNPRIVPLYYSHFYKKNITKNNNNKEGKRRRKKLKRKKKSHTINKINNNNHHPNNKITKEVNLHQLARVIVRMIIAIG